MACAVAEATIDAIEKEDLLENVTRVSAYLRKTCKVGPVVDFQGLGFLHGLRAQQTREGRAEGAARAGHPRGHRGRSGDPAAAARLHSQGRTHRPAARGARGSLNAMKNFLDLADLSREQVVELLALADRLQTRPSRRRWPEKSSACCSSIPSLRTLASFQAAMARLGGNSFVISAGNGTWQLETRRGAVMNGAPAEHVREGVPVLSHYCDALGIRAFASGTDLRGRSGGDLVPARWSGWSTSPSSIWSRRPTIPARRWPTGRRSTTSTVPRRAKFVLSWVNHPRALPLAVPAATVHMAAMRGMEVVVLRPEGFALPRAHHAEGRSGRRGRRRIGARDRRSRRRARPARTCSTPRNGAPPRTTATPRPMRASARNSPTGACATPGSRSAAVDCKLMHCLPVRRNVAVADEVLDGRRSVVQREAYNRMVVQTAVLHRLLATPQH